MKRRLAAILAADVVGYTRLMGADEAGTLQRFTELRHQSLEPLIAEHHGRIFKLMGDGLLVEFASVVDALLCAAAWHKSVAAAEATVDEGKRLMFRIGVNLGDVIVEGDDIHGDGVNIAARLEGLAEPGGICLSDDAYRHAKGKLEMAFYDLGEQDLKNVAEPVRVYRVTADQSSVAVPLVTTATLPVPDKPSLAVLPFTNMSGNPEQEYFSDGVTEDIITALSKFRWFFVIARNSTFTFKGQSSDIRAVAEKLGVRYVMEGSVRKAGNRVRVTGQLIDAVNGSHIWAERYDRELEDIFALQDEITAAIVGAVGHELEGAERERATKRKETGSLNAWDLYQRAMWHMWRLTATDSEIAQNLFERAIVADPAFAPAHAGFAQQQVYKILMGWADPSGEDLSAGWAAAQKAIEFDDQDAQGYCALGRIETLRGDPSAAVAACENAIRLNPNFAMAFHALGVARLWAGQPEEAVPAFNTAMRLSPNEPNRWSSENLQGIALWMTGKHETGIALARKASRHQSCGIWPLANLAFMFASLDRMEEAKAAIADALKKRPDLTVATIDRFLPGYNSEGKSDYLDALRKAGVPD